VGAIHLKNHNMTFLHIPKTGGQSVRDTLMKVKGAEIMPLGDKHINVKHPDIWTAEKHFGKLGWTFCIVRNPYDRIVSMWGHFCRRVSYKGDFREFVTGYADYDTFMKPQATWFNEGEVDYIIRYENLKKDFELIRQKTGCAGLPHLNKGGKTSSHKWEDDLKEFVAKKFKDDFERFNYKL